MGEKGINNKTYCIASGKTNKLYEYINIIKNNINPNIKLKLGAKPYAEKQVMNLEVDISELTKDTEFVAGMQFEDGIVETIQWYKNNNKI